MEIRIIESTTRTVTILHPKLSFAIFSITPEGSLFIDSDWGFYGNRWRGFGDKTFVEFLISINEEYFINKIEINHFHQTTKRLGELQKKALGVLFLEFQKHLKSTK